MGDETNARNLVIKVKYGDSLRRICARLTGNSIDHGMSILKSKIVGLFKFSPDADLVLRYTDVDGDLVTLETDEELSDAIINQSLDPLRVIVQLNNNSEIRSESSGTNTLSGILPEGGDLQNQINFTVKEALKFVPEPVQDALSKFSQDFLSKAAASAPAFSGIMEYCAKLDLSNHYPSQASISGTHDSSCGASFQQSDLNMKNTINSSVASVGLPLDVTLVPKGDSADSTPKRLVQLENFKTTPGPMTSSSLHTDSIPRGSSTDDNQLEIHKKNAHPNDMPTAPLPVPEDSWDYTTSMETSNIEQFPAVLTLESNENGLMNSRAIDSSLQIMVPDVSPCPFMSLRRPCTQKNDLPPDVHNVTCHGCQMSPIVGPCYKSNVKNSYVLCSLCFSQKGKDKENVHIDQSTLPFQPCSSVDGCCSNPHTFRGFQGKSSKAKLESLFVRDITILDGTLVAPSTRFTKIWRMQNNGVIPWPRGTQLVWIGGDKLSNRRFVELNSAENDFPVNKEVDIAVDCIAPSIPGRCTSCWRLATLSGQKFGQLVWVRIQVSPLAVGHGYRPKFDMNLSPQIEQGVPGMVAAPFGSSEDDLINFPDLGDLSKDNRCAETALLDDTPFPGNKLTQIVPTMTGVAPTNLYPSPATKSLGSTFETSTFNGSCPVDPSAVHLAPQTVPVPPAETPHLSPSSAPGCDPLPPISGAEFIPLFSILPEIVFKPSSTMSKTNSASSTAPEDNLGKTTPVLPASPEAVPVPPLLPEIVDVSPRPVPKFVSFQSSPTPRNAPLSLYPSMNAVPTLSTSPQSALYPSVDAVPISATVPPSSLYASFDAVPTSSTASQSASMLPSTPARDEELELLFLKDLEGMGFIEVELNKKMLRKNDYDIEKTIDDLCGAAEWDSLLNELRDMGFLDEELNKKLLIKNDLSIKLVVLDLIDGKIE